MRDEDKPLIVKTAQNFQALGYGVCATRGTAEYLKEHGIIVQAVNKVQEGRLSVDPLRPHAGPGRTLESGCLLTLTCGHQGPQHPVQKYPQALLPLRIA